VNGRWSVSKDLRDSEGVAWIRGELEGYDWSKADWITIKRGRSEKFAFRGVCKSPWQGRGYRINCNVSRHAVYPLEQYLRLSPLYRNSDGSWPGVPEGCEVGDRRFSYRNGREVHWRRLYRPLEIRNEEEALVFLIAHEAAHYLRKTKQIPGRHGEILADTYAEELLRKYRRARGESDA
jgi:hypothetical protein